MMNKKALRFFLFMSVVILATDVSHAEARDRTVDQAADGLVPGDFNWEVYVNNYPKLRRAWINTEEKAKRHWLEFGVRDGRTYR